MAVYIPKGYRFNYTMKKRLLQVRVFLFLGILVISLMSSCITNKKTTYFQDVGLHERMDTLKFKEPVIQIDDILSISITTIDAESAAIINQGANTPVLGGTSTLNDAQQINGFLVDKNGEVEFAMLGKVKVAGFTTYEAREFIREKASTLYNKPKVQVRFANFKITVLGEVLKPATYTLPNEKVSILDVIGLAGDLTIYGLRENVLVIREQNGKKEFGRLNLNSVDIFNNPYYYLRQNDVVYVEPNKSKIATTDASRTRLITIGTSIASAMIVLLIRIL